MKPVIVPESNISQRIGTIFRPRLAISERRLMLITLDTLLIIVSLVGSLIAWERVGSARIDLSRIQSQAYWLIPVALGWLAWLALSDSYHLRLIVRPAAITWRILVGGLAITFLYLLVFFVTSRVAVTEGLPEALIQASSGSEPIRFAPAVAISASTSLLLVWRLIYIWLLCGPQTRPRLLILGAGYAGSALSTLIAEHYTSNYHVVGFVDDAPHKQGSEITGIPVLGVHQDLDRIAWSNHIDEIALAISERLPAGMLQALMTCHERGITISPMPLVYERLTGKVAVNHIGSQWYVALPLQPRAAATALAALKRLMDLLGGLLIGMNMLLFGPLIAIAIRLDSKGPIFYRQERLGLHGRSFWVVKFRSMYTDAEQNGEARWAAHDDPRITRVGAFLRRTRLDELPQVINVLRGEMSLVGPRPERPQFVDQLQSEIPFYRTRLAAKPGLTGWAQINYGYGSTVEDSLIKLQYDLYYLKHQTPWFDLLILARTIAVVLQMKGR